MLLEEITQRKILSVAITQFPPAVLFFKTVITWTWMLIQSTHLNKFCALPVCVCVCVLRSIHSYHLYCFFTNYFSQDMNNSDTTGCLMFPFYNHIQFSLEFPHTTLQIIYFNGVDSW